MEDDGFCIVKSKSRRAAGRRSNYSKKIDVVTRIDGSAEDISQAVDIARTEIHHERLDDWFLGIVSRVLNGRKLSRVLIVGNGHFDHSHEPGTAQLALAIHIQEYFGAVMTFAEPAITKMEKTWLEENDIQVVQNESDWLELPSEDIGVTMFYCLHGVHYLLNDFLWFNQTRLHNVVLVANDYNCFAGGAFIGGQEEVHKEYDAIHRFYEASNSVKMRLLNKRPLNFHHTSIQWLSQDVEVAPTSKTRPIYSNIDG